MSLSLYYRAVEGLKEGHSRPRNRRSFVVDYPVLCISLESEYKFLTIEMMYKYAAQKGEFIPQHGLHESISGQSQNLISYDRYPVFGTETS
jgi:hypothetical protein